MIDTTRLNQLLESARRQLELRNTALQNTLDELELYTTNGAPAQALAQIRAKRDRQHNACIASQQVIDMITRQLPPKTKK